MSIDEWAGSGIPDEICEQAAHWISRLDSDQFDDKHWQEFSIWLEQAPINRWAFEELSELWARYETLGEYRHLLDESKVLNFPKIKTLIEPTISTQTDWYSIAAIFLISLGLLISTLNGLMI